MYYNALRYICQEEKWKFFEIYLAGLKQLVYFLLWVRIPHHSFCCEKFFFFRVFSDACETVSFVLR